MPSARVIGAGKHHVSARMWAAGKMRRCPFEPHRAVPCVQNWIKAAEDAEKCISIKPDWGKGYGRKGAALHGMGDLEGAQKAYTAGLAVEPGACTPGGCVLACAIAKHWCRVGVVGKGLGFRVQGFRPLRIQWRRGQAPALRLCL